MTRCQSIVHAKIHRLSKTGMKNTATYVMEKEDTILN
jgi:hypothetical protein